MAGRRVRRKLSAGGPGDAGALRVCRRDAGERGDAYGRARAGTGNFRLDGERAVRDGAPLGSRRGRHHHRLSRAPPGDSRFQARKKLMGEEYDRIGALIAGLDQADKKAVRAAVDALTSMSAAAPEIAEKLRAALAAAPAEKRWPIAYALAEIAPLSEPCLEALEAALDFADPDIRWAVALLLVRLAKKPGAGAGARLIDLCKNGTPAQRRMALYCLRDIGAPELIAAPAARKEPDARRREASRRSVQHLAREERGSSDNAEAALIGGRK